MLGTLGIESNAAQPLYLNRPVTVGDVKGYVQSSPTGSGIHSRSTSARLTLNHSRRPDGPVATPSEISSLSQIPANTAVSIGITAVGTTFPGADLSVFMYACPKAHVPAVLQKLSERV